MAALLHKSRNDSLSTFSWQDFHFPIQEENTMRLLIHARGAVLTDKLRYYVERRLRQATGRDPFRSC